MRTRSGVLSIVLSTLVTGACAGGSEVALPAAPLMAFSDSLRIVQASRPGVLDAELEALDREEERLEARLRELERLRSEREALANLKREEQDLAEARRELANVRSDTTDVGGELRRRLVEGQTRMAEEAREVAEAEIDYVRMRLEAIEAKRRVIRSAEALEEEGRAAGRRIPADSAAAAESRAAARHRAERELVRAWATYADLQRDAGDRLREWARAQQALIEIRDELMGDGS